MIYTVHPDEIINECRRRIEARYNPIVATVVVGDGGDPASAFAQESERLRACQDHLLSMNPLPHNFRSDHYWQGYPPGFRVMQSAPQQQQSMPPPYYPPPQPQVIVVPSGGQQVVFGGSSPGVPTMAPVAQQAAPVPYGYAQPSPVPPPAYYSMPSPSAAPVYPSSGVADQVHGVNAGAPTAPGLPPSAPARSLPDVWSEKHEAFYTRCREALDGDAGAVSDIAPLAAEVGIPVDLFAERVVSERARTIEIWNKMQGAA